MTPPDQDFLYLDALFTGCVHRLVGFGFVVDQLAIAVVAIHRHQDVTARVGNAAAACHAAEATKHLRMDDAKARTGQHRHRQLRNHGQVEGDAVASLDATEIAEQCGELIDSGIEFLIGDGLAYVLSRARAPR